MKRAQVTYVVDGKEKTVSGLSFLYQNKDHIYEKTMSVKEIGLIFDEKVESVYIKNMTFDESMRFTCSDLLTELTLENCKFNGQKATFLNGKIRLIKPLFACIRSGLNIDAESVEIEHIEYDNTHIDGNVHAKNILVTSTQGEENYMLSGENIALEEGKMPKSIQIRGEKTYLTKMNGQTKALISTKKLMIRDSNVEAYTLDGRCQQMQLENSRITISTKAKFNGIAVTEENKEVIVTDKNIGQLSSRVRMISILKGIRNQVTQNSQEEQNRIMDFYLEEALAKKEELTRQYEAMMQKIDNGMQVLKDEVESAYEEKKVKELLPRTTK